MKTTVDTVVMIVCGLALATAMAVAQAQGLSDPTRPPAAPEAAAAGASAPAAAGLSAIVRREGAKPAAVINGEYVELGGKSGDARVVAIGEDSVTLAGPSGRETLRLLPGVEKKSAKGADKRKRGGKKKAGVGAGT